MTGHCQRLGLALDSTLPPELWGGAKAARSRLRRPRLRAVADGWETVRCLLLVTPAEAKKDRSFNVPAMPRAMTTVQIMRSTVNQREAPMTGGGMTNAAAQRSR